MTALFPAKANTPYRVAFAVAALVPVVMVVSPMLWIRSSYGTHEHEVIEQPVEFDHRHHVRDNGIDCIYCHAGAETRAIAGVPSTEVCMGCHGQIWNDSPLLAPVRESWDTGVPIAWRRVHALPDHVYFHHGVHTHAGVTCTQCHGDVGGMARVYRVAPLTMGWCLDCHRDPPGPRHEGRRVTAITTCSACHR